MKAASLFSGIGGFDLAVEMAGHEVVWMAEWDKAPRALLERRFGVPVYSDVDEIDYTKVEPVELLIGGGFPCQTVSSAGKRMGWNDPRWKWPQVVRAVSSLRPRVVVLENVDAIVRFRAEYRDVLGSLAALGYCVRWGVLAASDVGACHGRKRWFAVAHAHGSGREGWEGGRKFPASASPGRGRDLGSTGHDSHVAPHAQGVPVGAGLREGGARGIGGRRSRDCDGEAPADPDCPGLSERGEQDGKPLTGLEASRRDDADGCHEAPADPADGLHGDISRGLEGSEAGGERSDARADWGSATGHRGGAWGAYEPAIRRHEQVLGRRAPDPLDERGRLNVSLVEWMQMLPEGWVEGMSRTQALKALGNACVPLQGYVALTALGLPVVERQVVCV